MAAYLERENYWVSAVGDGQEALEEFSRHHFDLVVLDLMLPKVPGERVCRAIRDNSDVPIIMLTAKGEVEDRIIEMDFGEAEGLSAQEAHKRGWSFPWALDAEGHSITAPGGETYEHALARVQSLLDDLESVRGRTVLLTHGGISRSILRAIYGTPADRFWRIQISTVSSFVLSYDGKRYFLAALGLTPEEVKRRVEEDVVKDLDNWDGDAK